MVAVLRTLPAIFISAVVMGTGCSVSPSRTSANVLELKAMGTSLSGEKPHWRKTSGGEELQDWLTSEDLKEER